MLETENKEILKEETEGLKLNQKIGNEKSEVKVIDKTKTKREYNFKKGTSGNPKGRPKGNNVSITAQIKKELKRVPKGQKQNRLSQLVQVIFDKAIIKKDSNMIKQIWQFIDGLPRQQTDIKLDTDLTINIIDTYKPKLVTGDQREVIQIIEEKTTKG